MNRILRIRKLAPLIPRVSTRSLLHNPEVDEEGNRLKKKLKQVTNILIFQESIYSLRKKIYIKFWKFPDSQQQKKSKDSTDILSRFIIPTEAETKTYFLK